MTGNQWQSAPIDRQRNLYRDLAHWTPGLWSGTDDRHYTPNHENGGVIEETCHAFFDCRPLGGRNDFPGHPSGPFIAGYSDRVLQRCLALDLRDNHHLVFVRTRLSGDVKLELAGAKRPLGLSRRTYKFRGSPVRHGCEQNSSIDLSRLDSPHRGHELRTLDCDLQNVCSQFSASTGARHRLSRRLSPTP